MQHYLILETDIRHGINTATLGFDEPLSCLLCNVRVNLFLAFGAFFRYVHFQLLSASSIVSIVFEQPFFTIDGGIYVRNSQ